MTREVADGRKRWGYLVLVAWYEDGWSAAEFEDKGRAEQRTPTAWRILNGVSPDQILNSKGDAASKAFHDEGRLRDVESACETQPALELFHI